MKQTNESVRFCCILRDKVVKEVGLALEALQLVPSFWGRKIEDSLNFEGIYHYPFVGYDESE